MITPAQAYGAVRALHDAIKCARAAVEVVTDPCAVRLASSASSPLLRRILTLGDGVSSSGMFPDVSALLTALEEVTSSAFSEAVASPSKKQSPCVLRSL